MDYPNNVRTAREWLEEYKKYVKELESNKVLSEEKIAEYKKNFFALEMLAGKYDEQKQLYPDHYFGNKVDDVTWMLPVVEDIMNIFENEGDRHVLLDRINMSALETVIKLCTQCLEPYGKEVLVPSVVASMDNAFEVAINDKTGRYETEDGLIDVNKVVCEYPKEIIVIRELVTQKLFKNDFEDGNFSHTYDSKKRRKEVVNVSLINLDSDNLSKERELSYYDWAVMEAIHALYLAGNEIVDLDSIEAVLKHKSQKGTSDSKKKNREDTLLFDSVRRLINNYVTISDDKYEFNESGYIVDGKILISEGKIYLKINSECILARYACKKGHVNTYKLGELALGISYTDNVVALYRYMIQCVTEIYGTPMKKDLINGAQKVQPRNPNYDYISCKKVYGPILGKDANNTSKQETIRNRMKAIFEEMKRLGFIDNDKERCKYIDEKGNQHFKVSRS